MSRSPPGALGLWRYRNWLLPVLNVLVMFGLVQGVMLAGLIGAQRPILTVAPVMFMLGAVIGLVYEAANHFSLRAWKFGARPLLGVARDLDKAALIGVAWGATPVVIRLLSELGAMTELRKPRLDRLHAILLIIAAGLTCSYWTAFFLTDWTLPDFAHLPRGVARADLPAVYLAFESAFPLPDAFVAVSLAIAGVYLLGRDPKAILFGLVGAGGMIFLALIDIWFNVGNGFYRPDALARDLGLQIEVAINMTCLSLSIWTILRLWKHPLRRG